MPITREETLKQYTVNDNGVIQTPGKFEGEMLYAPYFWDCYLEGLHDLEDGDDVVFAIQEEDFDEFPELADVEIVRLRLDYHYQGFTNLTIEKVKESIGF